MYIYIYIYIIYRCPLILGNCHIPGRPSARDPAEALFKEPKPPKQGGDFPKLGCNFWGVPVVRM